MKIKQNTIQSGHALINKREKVGLDQFKDLKVFMEYSKHLWNMDTIFMKSENSRTSEYHVLVLKLADKLDLRRGQKSVAL